MKNKILIIDDSPLVLEMAKDILQEAGYEVFTAGNGIEANQYIYSIDRKPDLIIIDIMMPLLAGNKITQMLKQSEQSKDIPIVLISSKTDEDLQKLVVESDANGYIRKPFTKQGLIGTVRNHL